MIRLIKVYTDGACRRNPNGEGGWAAVILSKSGSKVIYGAHRVASNNQMELMAVIRGLEAVRKGSRVTVFSDSAYVVNCFRDGWWKGWLRRGWKTSYGGPVKNQGLWKRLLQLVNVKFDGRVRFVHVKGHNGDKYNEMADAWANRAIDEALAGKIEFEPDMDFESEVLLWGDEDGQRRYVKEIDSSSK